MAPTSYRTPGYCNSVVFLVGKEPLSGFIFPTEVI
jgi:hypothetical protein